MEMTFIVAVTVCVIAEAVAIGVLAVLDRKRWERLAKIFSEDAHGKQIHSALDKIAEELNRIKSVCRKAIKK